MSEKELKTPTPGGERVVLGSVLPLQAPFIVQIFPVCACNLRCGYCIYSLKKEQRGTLSQKTSLDFSLYQSCIDQMETWEQPIKMLRFAAIGEPLLHPELPEMIAYAKKANVAKSIDVVSNGTLLTEELSERLIRSGLSKLRISLNGLSGEDYLRYTGCEIDFLSLVENLTYFYHHRGSTKVYLKIIDYMVDTKEKQEQFFDVFSPICDEIAIEHLTPTIAEIDYAELAGKQKLDKPHNGMRLMESQICPQPFYFMQINPDGNVVPCCSMKYPQMIGNVRNQTVDEIWNGEEFNHLRRQLLEGVKTGPAVCQACNLYLYDMQEEDVLDDYAGCLKGKFSMLTD